MQLDDNEARRTESEGRANSEEEQPRRHASVFDSLLHSLRALSLGKKILAGILALAVMTMSELYAAWIWEAVDKPRLAIIVGASSITAVLWVGAISWIALLPKPAVNSSTIPDASKIPPLSPTHRPSSAPAAGESPSLSPSPSPSPATTPSTQSDAIRLDGRPMNPTAGVPNGGTLSIPEMPPFHVNAKTLWRALESGRFTQFSYVLRSSKGTSRTLISCAIHMHLTNLGSIPLRIDDLSIEAKCSDGKWRRLSMMPAECRRELYFDAEPDQYEFFRQGSTDLPPYSRSMRFKIETPIFNEIIRQPVGPKDTVTGWAFLVANGSSRLTDDFRFRIRDVLGREATTFISMPPPDPLSLEQAGFKVISAENLDHIPIANALNVFDYPRTFPDRFGLYLAMELQSLPPEARHFNRVRIFYPATENECAGFAERFSQMLQTFWHTTLVPTHKAADLVGVNIFIRHPETSPKSVPAAIAAMVERAGFTKDPGLLMLDQAVSEHELVLTVYPIPHRSDNSIVT